MDTKRERSLTFREIVTRLAEENDLPDSKARSVLTSLIQLVADEVSAGRPCRVSGLGTFRPVIRKTRICYNPRTREPIKVGKRMRVQFRPGHRTMRAVQRATELMDLRDLAHLMASELLLYNSAEIDQGIRNQDLEERLKGKLSDARESFLARIPAGVSDGMEIFEEALQDLINKRSMALDALQ